MAPDCDVVLVVGSANSSNSNRLVEVARRCRRRAPTWSTANVTCALAWLAGATGSASPPAPAPRTSSCKKLVECLAGLARFGQPTLDGR